MKNPIKYPVVELWQIPGRRSAPNDDAAFRPTQILTVDVVFTTEPGTRCALSNACALARDLGGHIQLIFILAVPYALPLTKPAVSVPFLQRKLANLTTGLSEEISVQIFLCRDFYRALEKALAGCALIVLGGRRRWWRTKAQKLERWLKKRGHEVIFSEVR
jgi:hypothetical protein